MPLIRKSSKVKSGFLGNGGQVAIEYVLLLVIAVGLLIALTSQIMKPFGAFMDNYMGAYLQCILETGELPSLGNSKDTALKDEGCNANFEAASLADGRPPKAGSGSGDGSSDSEGKGSGSSSGTYAGSSSRGGSRLTSSANSGSAGIDGPSSGGDGKRTTVAEEGTGGSSSSYLNFSRGETTTIIRRRAKQVTLGSDRLSAADLEALKKKKEKEKQDKPIVVGESSQRGPKKIPVKSPPPREVASEDVEFAIGNLVRIIFIAGIIIALVLLLGGQALQMSKDFEK